MEKYKKIILTFCLTALLACPSFVLAASANPPLDALDEVGSGATGPFQTPPVDAKTALLGIVGTAVGVVLSVVGIIFLGLMLFAGYNWMTAQGEEEKVTKAKSIIMQSAIGLVIVIGAYAVWKFVFSRLF